MEEYLMRYWLSWVQPTEDYRPIYDPPKKQAILGWWCSGYTPEEHATLCAVVQADNETQAKSTLHTDWPETIDVNWRFCEEHDDTFTPGDRFPADKPWMKARMGIG